MYNRLRDLESKGILGKKVPRKKKYILNRTYVPWKEKFPEERKHTGINS